MRPFRFFFFLAAGAFLFFFFARLLFYALIVAGGLSLAFFTLKAFRRMAGYHAPAYLPADNREWWLPPTNDRRTFRAEPLFPEKDTDYDWLTDSRRIEVR